MVEYEITLKINSISSVHNEYKWEGKTMRSSRVNPILLMKGKDELEIYDRIKELSEGTLEIVSVVKVEEGDQQYVQQMVEYVTNVVPAHSILYILNSKRLFIGLN